MILTSFFNLILSDAKNSPDPSASIIQPGFQIIARQGAFARPPNTLIVDNKTDIYNLILLLIQLK